MMLASALCALAVAPQAAADIEVPFRVAEDALIVDAMINGRKAALMFDTGFSGTVVLNTGIDIGQPTGKMLLRDFVGQFEAPTVPVRSLSLGNKPIKSTGMLVVQQPLADLSDSYNTHTDGIMGLEVVAPYVTEINFEKQKFIFHPKTTDITKRTPDNKKTFLAKLLPIGGHSLEMEVKTHEGKTLVLSLDTGNAYFATTHKEVLERVGLWDPAQKANYTSLSGVASGTVESWYIKMPKVNIYGVPVESSVWNIIDLPSSDAVGDGTIGFGFLKNFNIIIDLERRRVWLENFTGKTGNEPVGETGISAGFSKRNNRVVIFRVAPGSPAAKAGVRAGDQVLSVDGISVSSAGYRKMQQMLEGNAGSVVKLAISRGGQLMRFEVERTHLINEAIGLQNGP
jgi:predicted aspartyl protease